MFVGVCKRDRERAFCIKLEYRIAKKDRIAKRRKNKNNSNQKEKKREGKIREKRKIFWKQIYDLDPHMCICLCVCSYRLVVTLVDCICAWLHPSAHSGCVCVCVKGVINRGLHILSFPWAPCPNSLLSSTHTHRKRTVMYSNILKSGYNQPTSCY